MAGLTSYYGDYKLICMDIDGTLLDDHGRLLHRVRQSIRSAAHRGVQIALASGRMPKGVEVLEEELGVPCIKICNAGTYILLGEKCISDKKLLPGTVKNIYMDIVKKNHLPLWIFQGRDWYVTDVDHYVEWEMDIIKYHPEIISIEKIMDMWNQNQTGPNKLMIAAEPEIIPVIRREIAERNWPDIDMACSAEMFLEICPKGVSKGTALSIICENLGISLEDTVAFGDQELDISMLEKAGVGIAMGNAIDELKAKADFVTKTNNEAGIAYALETFFGKRF